MIRKERKRKKNNQEVSLLIKTCEFFEERTIQHIAFDLRICDAFARKQNMLKHTVHRTT